jgi:alcohol dehydrogenase (cytochrome c)
MATTSIATRWSRSTRTPAVSTHQFTPNDGHDWDSVQDVVLVDRPWRGQPRKLLLHADRNAHFYVLDRLTGQFLSGTPFVYQNWNTDSTIRAVRGRWRSQLQPRRHVPGHRRSWAAPTGSPFLALTGWFYPGSRKDPSNMPALRQP